MQDLLASCHVAVSEFPCCKSDSSRFSYKSQITDTFSIFQIGFQFFLSMRFLKYSLVKPCLAGSDDWLAPLASVFSSLAAVELFAEGPGTDEVAFWRDLGMSCNWVRERPRLKNKIGMISYELVVSLAAAVSTLLSPPSQNYRTSSIRMRSLKGLWSYS